MKETNQYLEAMRYIENANDDLKLAGRDGKFYDDEKYVKSACGIAYSGALYAIDFLFDVKKIPKNRRRKSIDYYQKELSNIDKKLLKHLNSAYHILHLDGYYDGVGDIKSIESGFESAVSIINSIKPYMNNGN